jgi:hypothetical protein
VISTYTEAEMSSISFLEQTLAAPRRRRGVCGWAEVRMINWGWGECIKHTSISEGVWRFSGDWDAWSTENEFGKLYINLIFFWHWKIFI